MPAIEGIQLAFPSQNLRVPCIAFFVFCKYAPYGVELSVLSQEVAAAQFCRRYIPDSHRSILNLSDMIPQHKLNRMRIEVMLPCEIMFIIFPHIMFEQRDRDYQRNKTFIIIFNNFNQFLFFIR